MANRTTVDEHSESAHHLKVVVEQSLDALREGKGSANTELSRRRALPLHADAAALEKAALIAGAKALAELWKVPEGRRVTSRDGVLRYSGT